MKFAIRFSDLTEDLNRILLSVRNDITKIYIIFDDTDLKLLADLNKKKKFIRKCENKLKKSNIIYDHIIATSEIDCDLIERNHIDVLLTDRLDDENKLKNYEYTKIIKIKDKDKLFDELHEYIEECNKPLLKDIDISDKPSMDKVWLKYYNKKAMSDYKRLSLQNKSIFEQIKLNNQDFLYETAIEIGNTDTSISYYELIENIEKYKSKLIESGIKYNDVVTIMVPNTLAGVYSIFAVQEIGAIPSLVHVYTKKDTLRKYLIDENSKAIFMIGMEDVYNVVKDAIKDTNVKKVISVPLTNSLSIKYKAGIKLLNSKLYKFIINTSKKKEKYKLDTKKLGVAAVKNVVTQLFTDFKETSGNFKVTEDDVFVSLDNFLAGNYNKIESKFNEIACIIHTGGSTAMPKATLITHKNLTDNVNQFEATIQDFKRGETMVTIPPIFHILGFNNCLYLPLRSGIKVVLIPKYNKNNLPLIFKKYAPEYFFAVPKIGRDILKQDMTDVDMSSLKYMVFGGEEMDSKFLQDVTDLIQNHNGKIKASQSLGATEATCSMTNTFNNCNVIGSLGIPLIGLDAKVVKIKNVDDIDYDNIEELGYNQVGELCFCGDSIMLGYLQEKFNTTTLRKHPDGKIWLHTFDAGYINENGIIFFEDRIKDMIKINGEQVYTSEIKKLIISYPLVEKCAVTCVLDTQERKAIIATITLKNNIYAPEKVKMDIINLCKSNLIKEAVPREIIIKEFMPETMYFKIDGNKLQEEYQGKQKKLNVSNIS